MRRQWAARCRFACLFITKRDLHVIFPSWWLTDSAKTTSSAIYTETNIGACLKVYTKNFTSLGAPVHPPEDEFLPLPHIFTTQDLYMETAASPIQPPYKINTRGLWSIALLYGAPVPLQARSLETELGRARTAHRSKLWMAKLNTSQYFTRKVAHPARGCFHN